MRKMGFHLLVAMASPAPNFSFALKYLCLVCCPSLTASSTSSDDGVHEGLGLDDGQHSAPSTYSFHTGKHLHGIQSLFSILT